jgi:hypothetical protein
MESSFTYNLLQLEKLLQKFEKFVFNEVFVSKKYFTLNIPIVRMIAMYLAVIIKM